MHYTIYKTTNKINNKIYIGKHQTQCLNDDYLGSGKLLNAAIKKYGKENFSKELLFVYDNEYEMNVKEAELVTQDFVKEDTNYNVCPGGKGGWGYINSNDLGDKRFAGSKGGKASLDRFRKDEEFRKQWFSKRPGFAIGGNHFLGRVHSQESLVKMRKPRVKTGFQSGEKNSQFGTCWVTKENHTLKINKSDLPLYISNGYRRGRK